MKLVSVLVEIAVVEVSPRSLRKTLCHGVPPKLANAFGCVLPGETKHVSTNAQHGSCFTIPRPLSPRHRRLAAGVKLLGVQPVCRGESRDDETDEQTARNGSPRSHSGSPGRSQEALSRTCVVAGAEVAKKRSTRQGH